MARVALPRGAARPNAFYQYCQVRLHSPTEVVVGWVGDLPETVKVSLELHLFDDEGQRVLARIRGAARALGDGDYLMVLGQGARLVRRPAPHAA